MRITTLLFIIWTSVVLKAYCQQNTLLVSPELNYTVDSSVTEKILTDLHGFLFLKEGANKENIYVSKDYLPETSALLDEMKRIEWNEAIHDSVFYKGQLTNLFALNDSSYALEISYMGINNNLPCLRAVFRLIAKRAVDGHFNFHAPLKENTAYWKSWQTEKYNFHFKDTINLKGLNSYCEFVTLYDNKLGSSLQPTEFYCCDNFDEALKLTGVGYKADYSGYARSTLSSNENNKNLVINGVFTRDFKFDPHDLFHERLRLVLSKDSINRPVDEGCAYLYGGSWGISWINILNQFKIYASQHPDADWVQLYTEKKNFVEGSSALSVAYTINALLVQQLEKEKGFPAVMQLLSCGKREEGDGNYFAALEAIMGISRNDFNKKVWDILKG